LNINCLGIEFLRSNLDNMRTYFLDDVVTEGIASLVVALPHLIALRDSILFK
jgi:hypothetical protein